MESLQFLAKPHTAPEPDGRVHGEPPVFFPKPHTAPEPDGRVHGEPPVFFPKPHTAPEPDGRVHGEPPVFFPKPHTAPEPDGRVHGEPPVFFQNRTRTMNRLSPILTSRVALPGSVAERPLVHRTSIRLPVGENGSGHGQ